MSGFPSIPLGDIAEITRDIVSPEAISSGTTYVGLENIKSGGEFDGVAEVTDGELKSAKFTFSPKHILYGKLRPYLAKIALPNFSGICSTDILPISPGPELDRRYLAYFLRQPAMIALATARSTGANLPRLSPDELIRFEVPLPPLPEQRRIASILDQADALRAKRRQTLTQLDEMARAIFIDMFGIPEKNSSRWPLKRLSEFCSPKQWPTITSQELLSEGYPVFGANGVIGHYSEYNHAEPTVLITCRGATCGTINISFPKSYVTGNSMALDDPDLNSVDIHYLAAALKERGLEDAISGSAQPQITRQSLDPVQLPIPPIGMQRDFSLKIQNLHNTRETLLKDAGKLDALFASLQHRAFRGEL